MRATGMQSELGVAKYLDFVASCTIEGCLYDLGDFPGAVPGDGTVHGELFRLQDEQALSQIDRYEGYTPNRASASLFVRRPTLAQPMDIRAWVYWYNGPVRQAPEIESGKWRAASG